MKGWGLVAVVALGGIATLWAALAARPSPTPAVARKASLPAAVKEVVQKEPSPTTLLVREAEKELLALCEERDRLLREKNRRENSPNSAAQIRIETAEMEILKHLRDGHQYLHGGKPELAVRSFERAEASIHRAPKGARGLDDLLRGVRASREKAVAALSGISPPPSVADGHYRLAEAHFQRNDLESARAECVKAIQADPNHLPANSLLRELKFLLGR